MSTKDKNRILLKLAGGKSIRRLVNIQVLRKGGKFFEYKITFSGFPSHGWRFMRGAVVDSVEGIKKFKTETPVLGDLEVGYHRDGNTFYKFLKEGKNRKATRLPALNKIRKPVIVLRVSGFNFQFLSSMKKMVRQVDAVLELKEYSKQQCLTCDFYLSKARIGNKAYVLSPTKKFRKSQFFTYEDEKNNIALHLHIYESDKFQPVIVILRYELLAKLNAKLTYYRLLVKKRLFQ